jgi:hypothetical protein
MHLPSKWPLDSQLQINEILVPYLVLFGGTRQRSGWGTMLQTGRSGVQVRMKLLNVLNLPNSSGRTMALGLTQLLTEMSNGSRKIMLLGVQSGRCVGLDNITAMWEPIVSTMWDHQHLPTVKASMACYGDSFTLWWRSVLPVRYELDCKYCYK